MGSEMCIRDRLNAAVMLCSNAANKRNPLKFVGVPQTNEKISAASGPKVAKFSCIPKVAPMCPHGRAHWSHLTNTTELSVCCGDAVLRQIALTICFCLVPCGRLSWLLVSFWAHVSIVHRIVSYRISQWYQMQKIDRFSIRTEA